jgi:hypothetical protein
MNACLDNFNSQNKVEDNSMSEYERQLAKLLECAKIEFQNAKSARFSLEELRSDLAYQFRTPDELDWDYLLDTVIRAKLLVQNDKLYTRDKFAESELIKLSREMIQSTVHNGIVDYVAFEQTREKLEKYLESLR